MLNNLKFGFVSGLPANELERLGKLTEVYNYHLDKNALKNRYYEGRIPLREVNLGLALPKGMKGLEIDCAWGAKTVDVLAARSMFDGFVGINGADPEELGKIISRNRFVAEYKKAVRDELKYGCTFATLARDPQSGCKIRFHSPETAAALWNGEQGRIDCGMAIVDTVPDESQSGVWIPAVVNYHTERAIYVLKRVAGDRWMATAYPHKMGRPLMEAFVWDATSKKPFGRSRLKSPIRRLIQGYVRTIANATIGLEFSTSPQKYLLGVTEDQYETIVNDKFKQYVGSIIAGTVNPETNEKPTFGQLQQGTISPHVEMMRLLATQFSAATGLSVTDTGIVNDANPTSSDAILAQSQTLVAMAEELNAGNGHALRNVALMALAIRNNVKLEELTEEQAGIVAHFKNPAMPSVAVTADAAVKIAASRQGFAQTDVYLEMIGFDQADIRRIKAQESRNRGLNFLNEIIETPETPNGEGTGNGGTGENGAAGTQRQGTGTAGAGETA